MDEWHCFSCTSVQWGTHQCYDRWHAQHKCLQLAPSVASMKITATQWLGSLPRRSKWGAWGSVLHLSRATALECCCHRWTCLWPTSNRDGPWQCPTQQHVNHYSDSSYHTGATPFSGCHCWTILWHHHGHQPAAPGGLGAAAVASLTISTPVFLHSMPKRELPSMALGALIPSEATEGPQAKWGGPSHPGPDGKPYTGISVDSHTRKCPQYHSHQSLSIPTNHAKNPRGSQHLPHPTAPGSPQGWSSQTARWGALVAGANDHSPRAATHNQGHHELPS